MRYSVGITIVIFTLAAMACGFKRSPEPVPEKKGGAFEPVAVIELFTSQGCSSCPPADILLAQTIADAKRSGKKILALSFHVDYWNRLGWADPFSDAAYSARQRSYVNHFELDGAYTPQMVINGSKEFVGSDKTVLTQSLHDALQTNAAVDFTRLHAVYKTDQTIQLEYALQGKVADNDIHFAVVALQETTTVKRGENGGRTLINSNIVRQLVTVNAAASGKIDFAASTLPAKENTTIIAFVQQKHDLKIIGAAMAKINSAE